MRRSGRRVANRGLRMEGEGLHDQAQPLAAGVVLRPGFSAPQSPHTDGNASCAAPLVAGHDGALGNNDSPQRRRPSASPPLLLPRFAAQVQPPNAPMLPSVPRTRGSRARPRSERSVDRRELLLCSAEASRSRRADQRRNPGDCRGSKFSNGPFVPQFEARRWTLSSEVVPWYGYVGARALSRCLGRLESTSTLSSCCMLHAVPCLPSQFTA